jgi:iron(III) transport system ATP-binding protein
VASVELKGLSKRYGEAVAVDEVSLKVEHGRLLCLLGPSGCGKTTTLRLIAGFVEPSAGEIVVGGKVLSSPARTVPPEARNMSMIFQSYALWPHMTVRLDALADRYPGELSGGQQQRVSLARALVVEPETLLLDEPLSNLDANLREEMRFEIRRLHDRYRYTTVYVTHDQAEAMTTADLIAVMNQGRVEQLAPPEEIYTEPRSAFVARFIGGANILRGRAVDDRRVMIAGRRMRCSGRLLPAGQPAALSVRQHDIAIATAPPPVDAENHLPATVTRQVFLGGSRDYTMVLEDNTELRVTAAPDRNVAPGEQVWLHLPADQVRALAEEAT